MLKEIAYRWGKKQILQKFELVLLICLRDPSLQQTKTIDDLLQLFCRGHKNTTKLVSACSEYLSVNGGKSVVLLLDGYDEYPKNLQETSLITDIVQRRVLPFCGLIVSSRPHASEHFHRQATIRVDILGFTATEREQYISQALSDRPHKVMEVIKYLHQHPSIDSICLMPFNIAVLLYLYKLGIPLPKNSTKLYHHFIYSTICRHLCKFGNPFAHNVTDLTDLPEPYNMLIKQLSVLSLKALNNNKLIFTLDEIIAACPDIMTVPGAINGFGLLQAVQHFGLYTKTITFNFIHFTIQEFLAAHCISHLPSKEELKVIKANFWSDIHLNVFFMYVSLTKGQRPSFKEFLSGGNKAITICDEFLKDQLKCFHLYYCFNEADDHALCNAIQQAEIFHRKTIDLMRKRLTAGDIECVSLFLSSSFNKEWVRLNLWNCYIQDYLLNFLYHGLCHSSGVTVDKLILINNGLTTESSFLISGITTRCKVKELWLNCNGIIGDDQQLYHMLTDPTSILQELHMYRTKLSSKGAIALFAALTDNNKLKVLDIGNNAITDDACDAITTALERNSCLMRLIMYRNPLSNKSIISIVQCLKLNSTLELLWFPRCPKGIQEDVITLEQAINKTRQNQKCQEKRLEIKFSLVY